MPKTPKNIAASVRARLNRFVIERLLYRLGASAHANAFVLKGATLLMMWLDEPHRGTRDLDLLGFGDNAPERLLALFREVLETPVADDGVVFDVQGLRVDRIREELAYGGVRLRTTACLAGACIPVLSYPAASTRCAACLASFPRVRMSAAVYARKASRRASGRRLFAISASMTGAETPALCASRKCTPVQ